MGREQKRTRHVQMSLLTEGRRPTGIGGWRPRAGRRRKPGAVPHSTRPASHPRFPQHVTLRIVSGVPSLAGDWLMKIIRTAIRESQRPDFRIVEFNVLGNHLHLVVEASGKRALSRGLQGFEVRAARRLNSALKRCGKLFAHRYHARALKTPTEVRNALRYVLLNRKHHAAEKRFHRTWVDPCSSGPWFGGWVGPILWQRARELGRERAPTVPAETWLLRVGWRERAGPLRFDDAPA